MSSLAKYHLGKASYVINLIEGLKNEGVNVRRLIQKSSLRYFKLDDPESMIPIPVMYEFIERVKKDLKIKYMSKFFYKHYSMEKAGAYGLLIASSQKVFPTIMNALKFGKTNLTNNNASFNITEDGNALYNVNYDTASCEAQDFMNDIDLSLQLELVLNANDEGWSPKEIHLIGSDTSMIEDLLPHCKSKIVTNQKKFGLVLGVDTLSNPLVSNPNKTKFKESLKLAPTTLSGKIEILLDSLSSSYLPGLNEISQIFNTSESSFKRKLAIEGITFSVLLERWRFMKAVELLTISDLKINEISDRLYYSNSANFQRAFKNWSGLNPTDFR